MTMLTMPDGIKVEQGGPEDKATWWTCTACEFTGPNVGSNEAGEHVCMGIICGGKTLNPDTPRIPWYDSYCCHALLDYVKAFDNLILTIDEGEISGRIDVDGKGIWISDGWTDIPMLPFNYCPFCGTKRNPE